MAAVQLDIPRLAAFADVPADSINELLATPSLDLLTPILSNVAAKAQQYEDFQSSNLRLKVELENVVRTGDAKSRAIRNSLDKSLAENAQLGQRLEAEESSKRSLETELHTLKSSTATSDSEVSRLRARITSLESSQRDALALVEKKSSACDDLASEVSNKHQKVVELRKENSSLEQKLSAANNSLTSGKLRSQESLQEAEALKRHNEWLDQELKTKSSEHSKFRKDKNTRISELQQQNEDATATIESLQRTEQSLRTRLQELSEKAEEYSTQIHGLREENNQEVENLKSEIETSNRLAELLKESLDTERQRQQDLSGQLDEVKQSAADEIGRVSAEIEKEHQDREAAERRIAELEVQVERLEADGRLPPGPSEPLVTPRSRQNASNANSPRRDLQSRASPAPNTSRGGINYTQLITDYHVAKNELDNERRRNEKLSSTIDEMIRDMEIRQPEITELQADHKRLESDVLEMSGLVDNLGQERDQAKKEARKRERQVMGLTKEGDVLRQQLRDLSSQIKVLLMEVNSQGEGANGFTQEERARLEALAKGDLDSELSQGVTDTDRFISQHLTTFRGMAELQEQNQKLLRVTRELGEKMEGEEAQAAKAQATQNQEELDELRQRFERSKDEIKILMAQSQSYIKERDMFRRILSHRGQIPQGTDLGSMFGESMNGSQLPVTPMRNSASPHPAQSPHSKDVAEFTKAMKELQAQYDNYRQEVATHRSVLREQSDAMAKQNSELRTEVSKKTSEATLAVDRYEMLKGNYLMLKSENDELRKRAQTLSERLSKQEIRMQQVVEDLVEAKGLTESLRNETANLKAEKEFWKTVEKRLNDDNSTVLADRDRANALNANLQNILNEREHAESEARRRLQLQVDALDMDLQAAKKKLEEESEESRRSSLRREYDSQQSASRIEDLLGNLSSVREELIAAKTTRDHLQARADELTVELRSAHERLEVLQPRVTSQAGEQRTTGGTTAERDISREQELSLEISELKRDLDLTQKELADNRSLIEQYKAISQSAEEELQNLNETQDQYRVETDRVIEDKDNKIRQLEESVENFRAEVSNVNNELVAAQSQNAEHAHSAREQQSKHDAETAQLRDTVERAQTAAHFHQEDLKKQAEIAQQAQHNYDTELVKHAEAAKSLQKVRGELNGLKLEIIELKAFLEAAQAKNGQNEESWNEAKERYERELREINSRKDDMAAQNRTLHDQLVRVNNQITDLRKHASERTSGGDGLSSSADNSEANNLHELIKYLRQEKDIVETQFQRSSQESKRLRQHLDHTQDQLDDVRLKLAQEQRTKENSERQLLNHNKLMETLDELNLYRESNSTLRLERNQIQDALDTKTRAFEELQAQLQPLQAKIAELEEAKEMQEDELRLAQEAKDRFEKRYLDLLNRSNAVDPAELENAQQKVVRLEAERAELIEARDNLQTKVDGIPGTVKHELDQANERFAESRSKLIDQSKNKAREQNAKIKEKDAALQQLSQEKQSIDSELGEIKTQLASLQSELERAVVAKDEAVSALAQQSASIEATNAVPLNNKDSGSEHSPDSNGLQNLREQLDTVTSKANDEGLRASGLEKDLALARARIAELEQEIVQLQQSLDQANSRVANLEAEKPSWISNEETQAAANGASKSTEDEQRSESLNEELRRLSEEAEQLRVKLSAFERAAEVREEGSISVAEQISSQVEEIRQELTARHELRVKQAEEKYNARAQTMKETLNKRLVANRTEMQQKLETTSANAVKDLKQQHSAEIEALNQRHAAEIAELRIHTVSDEPSAINRPAGAIENSSQTGAWEPSETDIRELLQKNEVARKMVVNSLNNRERKIRDEEQKKLKEQLGDLDAKIAKAKRDAEGMVEAKFAAKFNLTENRLKSAQAKVDYVQNASQETPDKAVSEVWTAAKDAKPAVAAPKPAPQEKPVSSAPTMPIQQTSDAKDNGPISKGPGSSDATESAPLPSDPFAVTDKPNPFAAQGAQAPSARKSSFGQPTAGPGGIALPQQGQAQGTAQRPSRVTNLQQSSHAPQSATTQAAGEIPATDGMRPAVQGTSSGTLRPQQSGLPVASVGRGGSHDRGGSQRGRGSNIARPGGRGRGGGRGSMQAVNTTLAQNAQSTQRGSPQSGRGMNPNAQQFVPQKRNREESGLESSEHAGDEKRLKGGGA